MAEHKKPPGADELTHNLMVNERAMTSVEGLSGSWKRSTHAKAARETGYDVTVDSLDLDHRKPHTSDMDTWESKSSADSTLLPEGVAIEHNGGDIAWRLCETGVKFGRKFYRNEPWTIAGKEIDGYTAKSPETDSSAVLRYTVECDSEDLSFRNFRPGKYLKYAHNHQIQIKSVRLIKVMNLIMDYYPFIDAGRPFLKAWGVFFILMLVYGELKAYFNTFIESMPEQPLVDDKYQIGDCGDERIAKGLRKHLEFGALDILSNPCDEDTAKDIAVFLRLLAPMYREAMVPTLSSIVLDSNPQVEYFSLWQLFRPGKYVYVKQSAVLKGEDPDRRVDGMSLLGINALTDGDGDGDFSACVVAYIDVAQKENNTFGLVLWELRHNGIHLQRIGRRGKIPYFSGFKPIMSLPIIPSKIYDSFDSGSLRRRLEQRGERYLGIVKGKLAHREYHSPRSGYIGQIIVDPEAYRQYAKEFDNTLRPGPSFSPIADGGGGTVFGPFTNFDMNKPDSFKNIKDVYLLLPRTTEGLALKTKKWMVFDIDHISDSAPMPSPNQLENELVLASDADRKLLQTVLPKGQRSFSTSSDFVPGKGEGRIFLLYGPPGSGKTLTVECIANDTRRPLLRLTADDFMRRRNTEFLIQAWFHLAAQWEAIILIDEADSVLEQRKEGHDRSNMMSLIFLRTVEYYRVVMFLTTNRLGLIDDSFISRITCPIAYHQISPEGKGKIVNRLVTRFEETGTISFEQVAVKYLINNCENLNGREIRNVLYNAIASAELKLQSERKFVADVSGPGQNLEEQSMVLVKMHQIKAAVERQTGFQDYLKTLRGRDEAARARAKQDYIGN